MKKGTRILASVLCAALLASLAGCGSGKTENTGSTGSSGNSTTSQTASSSASESKQESEETAGENVLPIFAEKTTLRFWFSLGATNMGDMKDYNMENYTV